MDKLVQQELDQCTYLSSPFPLPGVRESRPLQHPQHASSLGAAGSPIRGYYFGGTRPPPSVYTGCFDQLRPAIDVETQLQGVAVGEGSAAVVVTEAVGTVVVVMRAAVMAAVATEAC